MNQYRERLPFVIFHNQADTLLLSDELEQFVSDLRSNGHPVSTFFAPGDHNFIYENFDFREAIGRLGRDSIESGAPLRADGIDEQELSQESESAAISHDRQER
jgi:hypothetical protein